MVSTSRCLRRVLCGGNAGMIFTVLRGGDDRISLHTIEPELHFVRDQEVAVPDLAGWRRERMPSIPEGHRFEVVPDWVCQILSPSTASKDREIKLPLYAHYGVAFAWLIDPKRRTLEAHGLEPGGPGTGRWRLLAEASGEDCVKVPPFGELALELATLWV